MRSHTILLFVLATVGFGAVATVMGGIRRVAAADHRFAAVSRQSSQLAQMVQQVRRSALEWERRESDLSDSLAALQAQEAGGNIDGIHIESPKARKVLRAWARLYYGELIQKLQLSLDQIDRFEELLANHKLRVNDIVAAARDQGLRPADPSLDPLWAEEATSFQQQLSALLGPEAIAQIRQYDQAASARFTVGLWAGLLYDNTPIAPQSGDRLIQMLTANGNRLDPVRDGLASVLSPEQMAVVNLEFARRRAMIYLMRKGVELDVPLTSPGLPNPSPRGAKD